MGMAEEERDFYIRRVAQLERELEEWRSKGGGSGGGGNRVVFHSEQCLDKYIVYGYPCKAEAYRPIAVGNEAFPQPPIDYVPPAAIRAAPAPAAPPAAPVEAPRGTFGPAGKRDLRDKEGMRGFASRIRHAKQVSHNPTTANSPEA